MSTYTWNPGNDKLAPRLAPAWHVATDILTDGMWHSRTNEIVPAMLGGSDLAASTCANLVRQGVKYGLFEQRGTYPNQDVRMRDTPENVTAPGAVAAQCGAPDPTAPGVLPPRRSTTAQVGGAPGAGIWHGVNP